MASARVKRTNGSIQFWLPDPKDLDQLMELLEICGYTDESLARDEVGECGESNSVIEVTVRRREVLTPQPWHDDTKRVDDFPDVVMQA